MDSRRFDSLIRDLASANASRRMLGRTVAAAALAVQVGWGAPAAGKKRRRKKKKKKPAAHCTPACTGNETCQSGTCMCGNGTKKCPGDVFDLCHECCPGAGGGLFSPDCDDSLKGEHCVDPNGDNVYVCGCLPVQQMCGDGECVACCTHQHCRDLTQDEFRICVGGTCPCNEPAGFFECPDGSFHEGECRHTSDDADACGPNCSRCDPPRSICAGGRCCFPPGQSCDGNHRGCCSGENACGAGFICA